MIRNYSQSWKISSGKWQRNEVCGKSEEDIDEIGTGCKVSIHRRFQTDLF